MAHWLARLVAWQDRWATPLGDFNHRWLSALFRPIRPIKDLLNGTWLGHPVHAAITDVPVGRPSSSGGARPPGLRCGGRPGDRPDRGVHGRGGHHRGRRLRRHRWDCAVAGDPPLDNHGRGPPGPPRLAGLRAAGADGSVAIVLAIVALGVFGGRRVRRRGRRLRVRQHGQPPCVPRCRDEVDQARHRRGGGPRGAARPHADQSEGRDQRPRRRADRETVNACTRCVPTPAVRCPRARSRTAAWSVRGTGPATG